jgi:uncharacterized DUF497 family protein
MLYCKRREAAMPVIWNDDPGENVEHIQEHGLTVEDIEYVLNNHTSEGVSRSTDRPCVFGYTPDGIYIIVIYEVIDDDSIYPITTYEVHEI